MLNLIAAFVLANAEEAEAVRVRIAIATAVQTLRHQTKAAPDYYALRDMAMAQRKPLIVGVSCDPPQGEWLTCRVEGPWHDFPSGTIIVSSPSNGDLYWRASLPARATANEVRKALMPKYHPYAAPERRSAVTTIRAANC